MGKRGEVIVREKIKEPNLIAVGRPRDPCYYCLWEKYFRVNWER